MASKDSLRRARRGTTSPPTALANSRAAFSRRAQIRDVGACSRESERGGSCDTARAEDQDAASGQTKFLLEGAQNPDVVGIAAEERTIAPDDDGVDGANLGGERVAFFQVLAGWIACAEWSR